jgi:hypothetical protein
MDQLYQLRKQLERTPVTCPVCGNETDSLKSYILPNFTFVFVATRWKWEYKVACAKCMRKMLLKNAGLHIITANVLWPIVVLPRFSVNLTRTFVKGHSEDVINDLQFKKENEWK